MEAKRDVRSLLRKQLGKDVADAMLMKVDKMVERGASPAKIERMILAYLADHLRNIGLAINTAVHTQSNRVD